MFRSAAVTIPRRDYPEDLQRYSPTQQSLAQLGKLLIDSFERTFRIVVFRGVSLLNWAKVPMAG